MQYDTKRIGVAEKEESRRKGTSIFNVLNLINLRKANIGHDYIIFLLDKECIYNANRHFEALGIQRDRLRKMTYQE